MRGADQAWIPARATVPVRAALLLRFRPLPEPLLSHSLPVGSAGLLEFRLCRAIRLTLFLPQDGSVSHARSWANREALPACDTYLLA